MIELYAKDVVEVPEMEERKALVALDVLALEAVVPLPRKAVLL